LLPLTIAQLPCDVDYGKIVTAIIIVHAKSSKVNEFSQILKLGRKFKFLLVFAFSKLSDTSSAAGKCLTVNALQC